MRDLRFSHCWVTCLREAGAALQEAGRKGPAAGPGANWSFVHFKDNHALHHRLILVVLWLLGLLTSVTAGGLIHILLVIAIVVIVLGFFARAQFVVMHRSSPYAGPVAAPAAPKHGTVRAEGRPARPHPIPARTRLVSTCAGRR